MIYKSTYLNNNWKKRQSAQIMQDSNIISVHNYKSVTVIQLWLLIINMKSTNVDPPMHNKDEMVKENVSF